MEENLRYTLELPSKSFLLGEYSVMQGGLGLLVATEPIFRVEFDIRKDSEDSFVHGLSPHGPPMDFLKNNLETFSNYKMQFFDPHDAKGGFGWSSAQFLFLYALKYWHLQGQKEQVPDLELNKLLEEYLNYAWNGEGWAPSGLDVISQSVGNLLAVTAPKKIHEGKLHSLVIEEKTEWKKWPFKGIDFCLLRTGSKLATHTHLSSLKNVETTELDRVTRKAVASIENPDEESFIDCVNEFRELLQEQELVDEASAAMLKELKQRPEVLAMKGCGALGADVILVLLVKELIGEFKEWAEEEDYQVIASSKNMAEGLCFKKKGGYV